MRQPHHEDVMCIIPAIARPNAATNSLVDIENKGKEASAMLPTGCAGHDSRPSDATTGSTAIAVSPRGRQVGCGVICSPIITGHNLSVGELKIVQNHLRIKNLLSGFFFHTQSQPVAEESHDRNAAVDKEALLDLRLDLLVRISSSSINDVCFIWLAEAVECLPAMKSSPCIKIWRRIIKRDHALFRSPDCPAELFAHTDRELRDGWAKGLKGGWSHKQKVCAVQLLMQLAVLCGVFGEVANMKVRAASHTFPVHEPDQLRQRIERIVGVYEKGAFHPVLFRKAAT